MKKPADKRAYGAPPGSYTSYIVGFIYSLALTLAAYTLVSNKVIAGNVLLLTLMGLAAVQLFVQLLFFLHLGRGADRRWNLMVFGLMAIVLVILVGGSLWIMYNLNYHMPTNQQVNKYLQSQDGL